MTMASRIAIMSEGHVLQVAPGRHLRDAGHALRRRLHRQRQPDGRHARRGRGRPLRDRLRRPPHYVGHGITGTRGHAGVGGAAAGRSTSRARAGRRDHNRGFNSAKGVVKNVLLRQLHRLPPRAAQWRTLKVSQNNTQRHRDDELTWGSEAWAHWSRLSQVVLTQ